MRMRLCSLVGLIVVSSAVSAGAQETRVSPRGAAALRQWDATVTASVRAGDLRRRSVRADTLVPGRRHERYDQYERGVRVYGADIARQLDSRGQAVSIFGTLYSGISIPVAPTLSQGAAKQRIEALGGATLGEARQPELLILPLAGGRYALTWHERIFSPADGTMKAYFLDAHTGAVVKARNEIKKQGPVGRGTGVLGDQKKMSVTGQGGRFIAQDALRPPDLVTFDMKGDVNRVISFLNGEISLGSNDVASDTDNVWADPAAVDAHAYAGFTYDYLFKRFGRRGLDNDDIQILSLVHPVLRADLLDYIDVSFIIDLFYLNAAYFGNGVMVYGEGLPPGYTAGGQVWDYVSGALDIVAHELTHGVTDYSSGLIYEGESGALNESYSDIVGSAVEFFFQERGTGPLRSDWLMGEDVIRPGGLRNMANPAAVGDPDHYSRRYMGTEDGGGVHTNSAISNLAYVLAIEGGPHPRTGAAVQGVGFANREQIERVFYRAFTQLMPANTNFRQARAITLQAARDLYAANPAVEAAIAQAWSAVGVN